MYIMYDLETFRINLGLFLAFSFCLRYFFVIVILLQRDLLETYRVSWSILQFVLHFCAIPTEFSYHNKVLLSSC